jgi:hypothetical protein
VGGGGGVVVGVVVDTVLGIAEKKVAEQSRAEQSRYGGRQGERESLEKGGRRKI